MAQGQRQPLEASGIFLLAALVGVIGGSLGFGFRWLLGNAQGLLMPKTKPSADELIPDIVEAARALDPVWTVLMPAIGGLAAGLVLLLIHKRCPFGISDIMEMTHTRKTKIHPVRSLLQILSSACSLASGGSLGREGAITQLGSTSASLLARLLKQGSRNRVVLLACGTAAGMASSYNAPIAGAIFVMEVILGSFAMEIFAPLVVSSVISTIVTRTLMGEAGEHAIYEDSAQVAGFTNVGFIFSALLLGALCGVGGVLFSRLLELTKAGFKKIPGGAIVRLTLGGLIVGAIGLGWPEVWGNGYEAITKISGDLIAESAGMDAIRLLLAILLLKAIATAVSTGSGAFGGVFTPTLVIGASFGAFFAYGLGSMTTLENADRATFVLVGMAGICAATTHAPITAVILVFELTSNYAIILPVMLCSIIASLVARSLDRDSYYDAVLRRRGHMKAGGIEELAMQSNYVRDIMRADPTYVHDTDRFETVMGVFSNTRRDTIYVVDQDHALLGRVNLHDVKSYINDPSLASVMIAAELTRTAVTANADENLAWVLVRFDDPDLDELAVVAPGAQPTLVGRITRRDLMACLSDEVLGHRKLRTRFRAPGSTEDTIVQLPTDCDITRVSVPAHLVGRSIGSLGLPATVLPMVIVETGADGLEVRGIAEPQKVLIEGSDLIVLTTTSGLQELQEFLKTGS